MGSLGNNTALITGCNRGIGKATVEAFAAEGANIICAIRRENLEFKRFTDYLEDKFDVSIEHRYFDLSDENSIKSLVKGLNQEKRKIDILVNNAGIPAGGMLLMTSMQKIKEVFQINYCKDDDEAEIRSHYQYEQRYSP